MALLPGYLQSIWAKLYPTQWTNLNFSECGEHEFQCADSKICLPNKFQCDGKKDCVDYTDEYEICGKFYV